MRPTGALCVALVVFLAGCSGSGFDPGNLLPGRRSITAQCDGRLSPTGTDRDSPADPSEDPLGREAGVWHDESIDVDQSNGLTCSELERAQARTKARVESIRRLEFESTPNVTIVPESSFTTPENGTLDPSNYSDRASAGWAGDRLVVYRNGGGELAYAWKLAFDSGEDARKVLDAYESVLQFRGARQVDGRPNVWCIPAREPFADAFAIVRRGDTVLEVNAPTVGTLGEVRPGVVGNDSGSTQEGV